MNKPFSILAPLAPSEAVSVEPPQFDGDGLRVITPIPDDVPLTFLPHLLGPPTQKWVYRDAEGRRLFVVARWDTETGKEFAQLTYCEAVDGSMAWRWKGHPAPRPLYGLDKLAAKPNAPVVIVEGEISADAAQQLLPDYIAITSPGGSGAAGKSDWSPLQNRSAVIWPDADQPGEKADKPGEKYAIDVARLVPGAKVISPPKGVKAGWDAANTNGGNYRPF